VDGPESCFAEWMEPVYRVLVVDDHAVVLQGLRLLFQRSADLDLVGDAANGAEAVSAIESLRPDVVVADLDMPGGGLDFLVRVHDRWPSLRLLVLSQHGEREFALRSLSAGAHGYVNKEADPTTLLDAVRRVASGRRYLSESAQERALEQLSGPDPGGPPHDRLSSREFEVFMGLARGKRVSELATELGISIKTVSTHRTRVLEKLGMGSNVDLALYARDRGLLGTHA
jgi:two-component system, NarL family, invasion response regulator UvrY